MIQKLQMTNCRQHKKTTLEFVPGVNTIVGANNSGKSTIPEMIEFALYGAKALRDNAKGYISDGETDGSAIVVLHMAGDKFQVGRNSKDAKILKNGVEEASYKSNVTRYIAAFTGVNQVGFRLAHYVRQKELAAFSQLRPGKRQETIEKMLKVHAVDRVLTKIKSQIDSAKTLYEGLLAQTADVEAEENELADLMLVSENSRQHPYEWTEEEKELKAKRQEYNEAMASLNRAQEAVKAKDKLLRSIESMEAAMSKIGETQTALQVEIDAIAALGPATDEHYRQLKTRVDELAQLEVQAAKMSSLKKELDEVIAEVEDPGILDSTELDAARAEMTAAQNAHRAFESLDGKSHCPTCQQEVLCFSEVCEGLAAIAEKASAAFEKMAKAFHVAEMEHKKKVQDYRDYIAVMNRRTKLAEQYVEIKFDAEEQGLLKQELEQCHKDREAFQKHEGERRRLETVLDNYAQTEKRLDDARKELLDIGEPDVSTATCDSIASDITQLEIRIKEIQTQETERRESLARMAGRISELQGIVERNQGMRDAAVAAAADLAVHQSRQANFIKFKKYMTAKIRPMLQEVAEALFHRVTKNRYASMVLGSDYDIILTTHKGFIRKLDTISGSENDLANLCLRLAIATLRANKLAGSLGFIILDEISSSFDDKRTKQTLEGLLELRDVIPQIINITHKPVEMKYADRLFTVEEIGGVAQVTTA